MSHRRIRVQNPNEMDMFRGLDYSVSRAVQAGQIVHLQGQTGIPLSGVGFIGEDNPAAQAENAIQCVKVLLEEDGSKMEDIVKTTTYVTTPHIGSMSIQSSQNTWGTCTPAPPAWWSRRWRGRR